MNIESTNGVIYLSNELQKINNNLNQRTIGPFKHHYNRVKAVSDSCGDNLSYSINSNILTISGTGDMYNYDETNKAP